MNRPSLLMLSLLALAVPPTARAAEPRPPGRGPEAASSFHVDDLMAPGPGIPAQLAEGLGIPKEKLGQIRDAAFGANDELITLEANARRAQLQLDRLMAEPSPDEKKVLGKLDEVGAAEVAIRKNRVRLLLRVRAILGPDLWARLQQLPPPFDAATDSPVLSVRPGTEVSVSIADIARVAVGDPTVADIRVEQGRIHVKGTTVGRTTLLVWAKDGKRQSYLVDVRP